MIVKLSKWNSERLVEFCADDMRSLKLCEGQAIRLKGRRTCHAIATLTSENSLKAGEIGLGLTLQKRLGITNGSEVDAAPWQLETAKRVQFIASTEGIPGEQASFMFEKTDNKKEFSTSAKLALSALAYLPVRKGENITVTPLLSSEVDTFTSTSVLQAEMFRLVMEKTVYIKIVDTVPSGEVITGPETEWCEADLNNFLVGKKDINFDMVGGLTGVKSQLREAVEGPLRNAARYKEWNLRPTKGILLFGPPGCGKTMLAKAVAKELEAELIYVRGSEIYNPFFGASEQIVRRIFEYARTFPRSVIFWDEFDAVGTARNTAGQNSRLFDTILNSILVEMDGMGNNDNIVVIAATNRLDQLDPALRRPGRFDFTVRVPLPIEPERREILALYLKDKPGAEKMDLDVLAVKTVGYTGADLENLVRIACLEAIEKEGAEKLEPRHMDSALALNRPSLTKEQVEYYEQMITGTGNPSVSKMPMFR